MMMASVSTIEISNTVDMGFLSSAYHIDEHVPAWMAGPI